jgi:ABC-2 type transport system ATP-binding protein
LSIGGTEPQPRIDIRGLRHSYAAQPVLRGLDLQVRSGELYALLGGNGAGKSTTVSALLGLLKPDAGELSIAGVNVLTHANDARARLAYVAENVALYEHLSALENLDYFLALAGIHSEPERVVAPALTAVGLPPEAWPRPLSGYSKGMRQKTAIALALARRTPVLILDEPGSGLDPRATQELNALLLELKAEGVAILMVTHDLLSVVDIADRIGFLAEGRIVEELSAAGPERFNLAALHRRYAQAALPM